MGTFATTFQDKINLIEGNKFRSLRQKILQNQNFTIPIPDSKDVNQNQGLFAEKKYSPKQNFDKIRTKIFRLPLKKPSLISHWPSFLKSFRPNLSVLFYFDSL
ncbi:hypothetical protein BpHYR1_042341 [Brachionus plicatilis]|uniref:Uncharacterized protein n=1 Tax=Brachionus plicatilis TaxID=10195 RepID=A0A3M7SUV5_BRAPC|nr:hypothetical protein BpHYR1_042341 [Brachionus plicatilis]